MRRKLLIVVLALALLIVVVGVWLTHDREAEPMAMKSATAVSGPEHEHPTIERLSATAREPSTAAASHSPVAKVDGRPTVDVLVVDRASGAPVAGAEVRWASTDATGPSHDPARPFFRADFETLLASSAHTLTDATGIAHIDMSVYPGILFARSGKLFGSTTAIDRRASPLRIAIANDLGFAIEVVDGNGKPVAGVPVGVRDLAKPNTVDFINAVTAENGIARIVHMQQALPPKSASTLTAHLAIPGGDAVNAVIDLESLPAEPIRLVLPAFGSVVVLVHDSDGEAVFPDGLNLAYPNQLDGKGNLSWSALTFRPSQIESGRAVYPFVVLGLNVYVDAIADGQHAHTQGKGPQIQDERTTFDLDMGPALPVIVGRLIDELSRPISTCDVQMGYQASVSNGATSSVSEPIRTDSDGGFRIRTSLQPDVDVSGAIQFKPYCKGFDSDELTQVPLPKRLHAGVNDLGDLVVRMPRVLVSGRVLDDVGAPVPLARVGGDLPETVCGRSLPTFNCVCSEKGEFAAKGLISTNRVRVQASCAGHVQSDPFEVDVGATGVTIVLPRTARLTGRVLLDETPSSARIRIGVLRPNLSKEERQRFEFMERVWMKPDGSFTLAEVRSGSCDVTFTVEGQTEPLVVVNGLDLKPGETCADPRLASIDLRGRNLAPASPSKPR